MTNPWNPFNLTQEDFIPVTDPITELQEQSATIRVAELTTALDNLQTQYKLERQFSQQARRKFTDLLTRLVELENNDVNETLVEAGITLPRKKFSFEVKVNATITVEAYGLDEEDAWNTVDDEGLLDTIDLYELEDVEAESSYERADEIEDEPINLRDFLGR